MKNNRQISRKETEAAERKQKINMEEAGRSRLLPESFREKMKALLGEEYKDYLLSFEQPCHNGLRINTLKLCTEEWKRICPFHTKPVPWIENGCYWENLREEEGERPSRHPYYYAGLYYLQEPSAMTPANLLPVTPGDRVLDICAAPGGKSTEIGAKLKGSGLLFSNDISNSRAKALLKNLEMAGIPNICVSSEPPEKLSGLLPEFFDCILADVPCSGEGMFRRDPDMLKSYQERGPEDYVPIQRAIAREAVKMLRPGGYLLYSTCTFDQEENEGTIRYILDNFPNMRLVNLPQREGFLRGIDMPECVRLFPHKIQGEGHFAALLKKEENEDSYKSGQRLQTDRRKINGEERLPEVLKELGVKDCAGRCWQGKTEEKNGKLYFLPEEFLEIPKQAVRKIRFLRTGLYLGEQKKGRFEPSQALAMALKKDEYSRVIDFPAEDERVIRYLKGETVTLKETELPENDGSWILVCTDGYPLGWAKQAGLNLKNKYYPGWRWQ